MAMAMFLMRTEIMKETKTFAMMPTMLASLVMVKMVMVTTVMALLTILVAMTAMMLVTHLTVIRSRNQGDIDGTSRIVLPCPSS